jgi:hypothetical protein
MSKFAAIIKGSRTRRLDVPITSLSGAEDKCDLRILNGAEFEACLVAATAAAKKAGAEPAEGQHVFDYAQACETVRLAALDPDDRVNEVPYFASLEEVKEGLDSERIFYLFNIWKALQDESSPRLSDMTLDEATEWVYKHVIVPEGQELPFERWQPVAQRGWVRILVAQLVLLNAQKSASTSTSSSSSSDDSASSPRS